MKGLVYATVECCGKRRGLLPGGVLVCSGCDHSHKHGTGIPNGALAKDVPIGRQFWRVGRLL